MNKILTGIKQVQFVFLLTAAIAAFTSCEKYSYNPPAVDPDFAWSLEEDIQPIFTASCTNCHGGQRPPDLREERSYTSLTRGNYVDRPAEQSRLISKLSSGSHASFVTEAEKLRIQYWIEQGAKNN
jgi:hypothetical protein